MGSKNQIAKWVIEHLPKKDNLYDLFGGGGAITHCACESGKFKHVIYNELNKMVCNAFYTAIRGGYALENRWISHEDFNKLKHKDPYVAICFSFGNDLKTYCYSKKLEAYKKACHYAVCFDDFSLLENLGVNVKTKTKDRKELTQQVKQLLKLNRVEMQSLECLERLQSLERLERLQSLERLERLQSLDYRRVRIKSNSVIYCDPPYKNTSKYTIDFNHNDFYSWCNKQKQLVIISEYKMPENFICIAQKEKISLKSKDDNSTKKTEKLFVPKHQYQMYLDAMAVLS